MKESCPCMSSDIKSGLASALICQLKIRKMVVYPNTGKNSLFFELYTSYVYSQMKINCHFL